MLIAIRQHPNPLRFLARFCSSRSCKHSTDGYWPVQVIHERAQRVENSRSRLAAIDPYRPIDAKRKLRHQSSDQVPERWLGVIKNACRSQANQCYLDQDRVSQYLADIPLRAVMATILNPLQRRPHCGISALLVQFLPACRCPVPMCNKPCPPSGISCWRWGDSIPAPGAQFERNQRWHVEYFHLTAVQGDDAQRAQASDRSAYRFQAQSKVGRHVLTRHT